MIEVEYLEHQGNDNVIANAARTSFNGKSWSDLPEGYSEEKRDKLIKYLADHRHTTPFRHNSITVRCKAPIFLVRQLGKHQAGLSWNEVSRRYVDSEPEFFSPASWRAKPYGSIKQGSGEEDIVYLDREVRVETAYRKFIFQAESLYNEMLEANVAPELARMVLPQSMFTTWVWTGNLLAFAHVYNERIDPHSQVEAQLFAKRLGDIIQPLFPVSWEALTEN